MAWKLCNFAKVNHAMKKHLTLLFPLLAFAFLIQSCSSTMNLRIPSSVPPMVLLPDNVQKVGLLNRSLPSEEKGSKVVNVVEGVISGEGIYEDRQGSAACIAGLETQLVNDNILTPVRIDSVVANGIGTGAMPMPLTWKEVDALCKQYGTDGILALEVFDTDQGGSMTSNTLGQLRNIAEGGTVRPPAPPTNTRVLVKMAWRFYDNVNRAMIDEVRMNDYFGVGYRGSVIPDLGEFAKRDAIQQSGYLAGRAYPQRFQPSSIWLRREFYQRKGDEMKRAARMVEVNDWDRAVAIWEPLTKAAKAKTAGRACYNMAIAAEVQGDIPLAIEWAQKAYSEHGDKRARGYVRVLKNRL